MEKSFHDNGSMEKSFHPNGSMERSFHPTRSMEKSFHANGSMEKSFHPNSSTDEFPFLIQRGSIKEFPYYYEGQGFRSQLCGEGQEIPLNGPYLAKLTRVSKVVSSN